MGTQLVDTQTLEAIVAPVTEAEGLVLVDVRHVSDRSGGLLRVLIERPGAELQVPGQGGVSLEDCTRVSRALSKVLDTKEDLFPSAYRLEVSSPGIERPLVKRQDFERFAGREAHLSAHGASAQRKNFTGTLVGVSGNDVVLRDAQGTELKIPLDHISKAHLVHKF